MTVIVVLVAIWLAVILGFVCGVAWKTVQVEDEAVADGEQLPARGSAHVDHAPPAGHRAQSRFAGPRNGSRPQVPHDSDGGRP